jgi:hypothetical protein
MNKIILRRLKIIAISAIAWNVLGVLALIMQFSMTDEMINSLPQAEQELYTNIPIWSTTAYAVAVFGGLIGSILLLMRKKLSVHFYLLSLIGVFVQTFYNFFISKAIAVYGYQSAILPLFVLFLGIFLYFYSKNLTNEGVLK